VSTFVSVGNCYQPFKRLIDEVERLAACGVLPTPVYVQHGHTPFGSNHCIGQAFLNNAEFESRVAEASVIIVHAGAGTILQVVHAGKVPIVMPRRSAEGEHVDDHQHELATFLASTERVVVANEPSELTTAIEKARTLQSNSETGMHVRQEPILIGLVRQTLDAWDRRLRYLGT
jgi:UDP-N-acetylglucosamine transferase subunit ALG13